MNADNNSPTGRFYNLFHKTVLAVTRCVRQKDGCGTVLRNLLNGLPSALPLGMASGMAAAIVDPEILLEAKAVAENSVPDRRYDEYKRLTDRAIEAYREFCEAAYPINWLSVPPEERLNPAFLDGLKPREEEVYRLLRSLEETQLWAPPLKPLYLEDLAPLEPDPAEFGKSANSANTQKKSVVAFLSNADARDLYTELEKQKGNGKSNNQIAREFFGDEEVNIESILTQIRRAKRLAEEQ